MVRFVPTVITALLVFTSSTPLLAQEATSQNQKNTEQEKTEQVRPQVEKALKTLYPTPIQKGKSIHVPYDLPEKTELTFRVTDFKGEKKFGFKETFEAGDNHISFNTIGLDIGNYILEVKSTDLKKKKELMLTVVK